MLFQHQMTNIIIHPIVIIIASLVTTILELNDIFAFIKFCFKHFLLPFIIENPIIIYFITLIIIHFMTKYIFILLIIHLKTLFLGVALLIISIN